MTDSPTTPAAKQFSADDSLFVAPLEGRYHLEAVIGRGGMGIVYRARDLRLDRRVAIKILRGNDVTDARRFSAEIHILARLVHPSLVRILDAGDLDGRAYLVMDLIEGPNLAQRLAAGPLSGRESAQLGASIASALAHVHDAGIIHRDVKPANVLIDQSGGAHLADFGIARLADTTGMTVVGLTLGTPAYLAPEQVDGTAVGASADVYTLGLVLIECLSGHRAFEGTPAEIAGARLYRGPDLPSSLSEEWRTLLLAMTARSPLDRPSAEMVATGLGRIARGDGFVVAQGLGSSLGVDEDITVPLALDNTQIIDPVMPRHQSLLAAGGRGARRRRGVRRHAGAIVVGLVMVGLVTGLALAGVFSGSALATKRATSSGTSVPTPSVGSTSTTATTSIPQAHPVASAAMALDTVITSGVARGTISPSAGSLLTNLAQPLLVSTSPPSTAQQIRQFDQFVQQFAQSVQNGLIIGTTTISSLTSSIDTLASALGTTVPPLALGTLPGGSIGPGHGHGHGHG